MSCFFHSNINLFMTLNTVNIIKKKKKLVREESFLICIEYIVVFKLSILVLTYFVFNTYTTNIIGNVQMPCAGKSVPLYFERSLDPRHMLYIGLYILELSSTTINQLPNINTFVDSRGSGI